MPTSSATRQEFKWAEGDEDPLDIEEGIGEEEDNET